MFGFFFGAACLIGLAAVARHGHHGHHRGCGGRFGHHFGHHGFGRHGFGRGFLLRRMMDRLETTPGQEKVIRDALHDLQDEAWNLRGEARGSRRDIAQALRGPEIDRAQVDRVFEKHDELIEKLRAALLTAVEKVHGTLDERQRRQLSDMIERGPFGCAGC